MRYDIADENLKSFVKDIWLVHDYDLRLLIERLVYNGKPANEHKNYLTSFFGEKYADKILAEAYHIRGSYEKENNNKERKRIAKKFIEDFEERRRLLAEDIVKVHEKVIEKYSIVSEIAEEICLPRFVSQN
jgi:hypothetical protein